MVYCNYKEGYAMKEIYAEPMIQVISLKYEDIITTSPGDGDNTIEDGFFDWDEEV